MMKRNITIGLFLAFIFVGVEVSAQSASELGLVLTGKEQSRPKVVDGGKEIYLHYTLRMTFENKGTHPTILINPTLGFGTGLSAARFFFRESNKNGKILESPLKTFELTGAKLENFKSMAQYFAEDKPPENMTIVLDPGETFSFEELFYVEVSLFDASLPDYVREMVSGKKDAKNHRDTLAYYTRWGSPTESLQLTYEFSFLDHASDPELLEKMSQKWRRFGRLPIGPNGTYTITSEKFK